MSDEIDTKQLKKEVSQIKSAMGISDERFRYNPRFWLYWGMLIGLASLLSQIAVIYRVPEYLSIIWFTLFFGGTFASGYILRSEDSERSSMIQENKPKMWIVFFSVAVGGMVVLQNMFSHLNDMGYYYNISIIASTIWGLIGIAYLLTGNTLKAYYIRAKDRYTFYIGGILIILMSMLTPNVEFLQKWTYSIFGVFFIAFSVTSYFYMKGE